MTMTANVVTLPRNTNSQARKHRAIARATKAVRRQATMACFAGLIATVLVGLSLSHLAHGIEFMGVGNAEAWAMAVGIDLGFISLELLVVNAVTEATRRKIERHARPAIIGTLVGSSVMNAVAFGMQASGWFIYPACLLGAVIPALIYLITRAATTAYLSRA